MTFSYYAIYKTEDRSPPPAGLIARESSTGPERLGIWSHRDRGWRFRPEMAAPYLYDDREMDRVLQVDRTTAEEVARENGWQELPTERELHKICELGEGDRAIRGTF